jgi:hypothetical protein
MKKVGTTVFIYEDDKKLYGLIAAIIGNYYKIVWNDGTTTMELISEFQPAGWIE